MKLLYLYLLSPMCWISTLVSPSPGQTRPDHSADLAQVAPGIVIEALAKGSEAEKAGMQSGDVLLHWVQGTAKGELESPFDLAWIEIEQSPKGNVSFDGLHSGTPRSWSIGPDVWGIDARPNFQGKALEIYVEGRDLAAAGKFSEAAEQWRAVAAQMPKSSWLASWLWFHEAGALAKTGRYKDSDVAYGQAAQSIVGADARIAGQLFRAWADSFQKRSEWDDAEKYYRQAQAEDERSGGENLRAALDLYDLGFVELQRGNLVKAEECYLQAQSLRQKLASQSLALAMSFHGLGNLADARDDLAKAEEYYRQALDIKQRLAPNSLALATTIDKLGLVALEKAIW